MCKNSEINLMLCVLTQVDDSTPYLRDYLRNGSLHISTNGHEVISLSQSQNTEFTSLLLHFYFTTCKVSHIRHHNRHSFSAHLINFSNTRPKTCCRLQLCSQNHLNSSCVNLKQLTNVTSVSNSSNLARSE